MTTEVHIILIISPEERPPLSQEDPPQRYRVSIAQELGRASKLVSKSSQLDKEELNLPTSRVLSLPTYVYIVVVSSDFNGPAILCVIIIVTETLEIDYVKLVIKSHNKAVSIGRDRGS